MLVVLVDCGGEVASVHLIFPGLGIKPRTSHVLGMHSAAALSMFSVGHSCKSFEENIQSFVQLKFLYLLDGTVIPAASDGHCRRDCAAIQARAPGLSNSLDLLTLPRHWEPSRAPCTCSLEAVSVKLSHSVSIAQGSASTVISVIQGPYGQRSLSLLEGDRRKLTLMPLQRPAVRKSATLTKYISWTFFFRKVRACHSV